MVEEKFFKSCEISFYDEFELNEEREFIIWNHIKQKKERYTLKKEDTNAYVLFLEDMNQNIDENFLSYVESNIIIKNFTRILELFLEEFFQEAKFKPIKYDMLMFNFPNEEYSEPMIKIRYPHDDRFDNIKIKDEIENNFKIFLAKNSKNVEEFKTYRKIQQKFRFIIRRE